MLLTAFLLTMAMCLLSLLSGPDEPTYKGHALSQWIEDISPIALGRAPTVTIMPVAGQPPPVALVNRGGQVFVIGGAASNAPRIVWDSGTFTKVWPPQHVAASAAIREMGTNAIPHLLHTIYARDSKFETTCVTWWRKQKLIKFPFQTAEEKQQYALPALAELGGSAVWTWIEIATNDLVSPAVQAYAAGQLASLRTAATPALAAMLPMQEHPNPSVQLSIRHAIQYCDKDGLLSALYNVRHARDASVRASGAWSLGFICQHPDMSVPTLVMALNDSNSLVRENAVEALGKFSTNALSATKAIRARIDDPARGVRRATTNALKHVLGVELTD